MSAATMKSCRRHWCANLSARAAISLRLGAPRTIPAGKKFIPKSGMKSDFRVINGYPPLISQELWEQCQKQKALNNHNGAGLKYSQKPFVLRGLITCGRTGRVCPCEDQLRRKYYSWVVCYTKTGQRRYIPEQDVLSAIETVLNHIKIPDSLINPLYEEIKNAEISEKQYCQQEIGKLRQEQEKLKAKLDNLFDLRLTASLR